MGPDIVKVKWKGYTTPTDGLLVCRMPLWGGDSGEEFENNWVMGNLWQIIHEESGRALLGSGFATKKITLWVAEALCVIADWTLPMESLCNQYNPKLWELVRRVYEENQSEYVAPQEGVK